MSEALDTRDNFDRLVDAVLDLERDVLQLESDIYDLRRDNTELRRRVSDLESKKRMPPF